MNRVNATAIGLLLTALAVLAVSCFQQAKSEADREWWAAYRASLPEVVEAPCIHESCRCWPVCECCKCGSK